MFRIHVLNVKLGDSLILETELNSKSYYSIIDCKSIEGKTPTVEFLQERGVTQVQSVFLTHLHSDHYSGFPRLWDYLREVNGTLEYFVSPQIPDEYDVWRKILELAHDQTTSVQLISVLKAMRGFLQLPSLTHERKKAMPVRMNYEGGRDERSWREHLHPALLFAALSPSDTEAFQLLRSAFDDAARYHKAINAISHAFLVRHEVGSHRHTGLFCGDLEGQTWRYVKNRCLEITKRAIRSELSFLKVPHHGASNHVMEQCLQELIDDKNHFMASISCPPGDPKHPAQRTLESLRTAFEDCCIACTNISALCHNRGFPSIAYEFFEQPPKEAEFLEVASSEQFGAIHPRVPGACAGHHTITMTENDCTLTRSTGLPCSFNPSDCRKEH